MKINFLIPLLFLIQFSFSQQTNTINNQGNKSNLSTLLPIKLYFHNDIPNPQSMDTSTTVNYIDSYNEYKTLLKIYQKEYSTGLTGKKAIEAQQDIILFFQTSVDRGVKELEKFRDALLEELQKGNGITISIKGFASPLANNQYNVNLTKRRIHSLINYLSDYQNGIFKPYISQGKLTFTEIPYGENTANKLTSDNPNDLKNSIYSIAAAIERKIEILHVDCIPDVEKPITLKAKEQLINVGKIQPDSKIERDFFITNTGKEPIEFENIRIPCDCNTAKFDKTMLQPQETARISMTFDSKGYNGIVVKSIYVKAKNQKGELRLVLSSEVER